MVSMFERDTSLLGGLKGLRQEPFMLSIRTQEALTPNQRHSDSQPTELSNADTVLGPRWSEDLETGSVSGERAFYSLSLEAPKGNILKCLLFCYFPPIFLKCFFSFMTNFPTCHFITDKEKIRPKAPQPGPWHQPRGD